MKSLSSTLQYFFAIIFLFSSSLTWSQSSDHISGQLFVQLRTAPETSINWGNSSTVLPIFNEFVSKYRITKVSCPFILDNEALQRTYLFEFENTVNTNQFIKELEQMIEVEYAEYVPIYTISYLPNDPMYSNQWHLQTVQAELAWDVITTQTSSIILAIVDDAVRLDHQDLQASIWQNTGEIPGDNIDNDGNGYIDDVNGWDAADNDNNPNPDNPTNSFFTHGTHCAGIAAARTDNNIGIASLGYQAQIMPIKTSTLPNPGAVIAGYAGVQYAIINQANVISMSWGGSFYSATYQLIFDQAYSEGIVCVAAAGNSNTSAPMYPASYNHVISVGATDQGDQKAGFSNYGSTIDVMAPGVAIYSSLAGSTSSYGNLQGTSMACPLVAGLAAMLLAYDPNLTPDDVENCIESSADDIYPLNPNYTGQLGAGRINAANAIACVKQIVARFDPDMTFACPSQTIQFMDNSAGTPTSWEWLFPGGSPASSSAQNPSVSYPSAGTYDVQLIVSDGTNIDTLLETAYITVGTPQATISGGGTIIAGYTGYLEFNFTGNAPWSVTYTDGTTPVTISGILTSPHYEAVTPTDTTTYTITAFSDGGCTGTFSGTALINIQAPSGSIGCTYAKYFGDSQSNVIHEIYYDIAEDAVYGVGSHDGANALFARFDAAGDLTFAVTVPNISGFIDIAHAPNGDKLCLSNDSEDIVIARFSNTGQLLWINRYDAIRERSPDIIASSGDTYILSTWYSTGGSSDDAAFMRIDGAGNILWSTKFHSIDDQPYELCPNGLGGAVFSGGVHGAGSVDMFVGEIDVNGAFGTIAEYNQAQNAMNEAYQVIKTINNEYVTVSKVNPSNTVPFDVNIMRLDANFDKLWEVNFTYSGAGQVNSITDLTEDSDGNLYVACSYNDGSPNLGAIIKFDAMGNYIWSKQLDDTRSLKVINTNSSPVDNLIFARLYDGTNFGNNDCFVARTDTSMTICNVQPTTTTFFNAVSTRTNLPFTVSSITFSSTPIVTTLVPVNYQTGVLCDSCDVDTSCVDQIDALFSFTSGCLDDTTFFTDQSTSLAGTVNTWAWNFGDGGLDFGNPNPTHIYTTAGTYLVTLTVTNDSTLICSDTYSTTIVVDNVMLEMPGDTIICLGDSVLLNPVGILCGSQVGWTYSWTPTLGMNNPNLQQPTVSPLVTTIYTVNAIKGVDTLIGSITIVVDQNCCSSHAAFEPTSSWCEGDTILFYNTSNAGANPNYEWDFGSANPSNYSGVTPPAVIFSGSGAFPVVLILTDDCGADTLTTDIIVHPLPIANAGPDKELCTPGVIEIGDSATAGFVYNWTPTALVDDSTLSSPEATVLNDTSFIVEVTDSWTGCSTSDTVIVTIYQAMGGQMPDDSLCFGDELLLDASSFGVSWLWQDGSTNPTFNVTTGGTYWVLISDLCSSFQDTIEVIEYECSCNLIIPNVFSPNGDGVNEEFLPMANGLCSDDYQVTIFNRWGNLIWSTENQGIVGWNGTTNKGMKVNNGTYFYLISYEGIRYHGFVEMVK